MRRASVCYPSDCYRHNYARADQHNYRNKNRNPDPTRDGDGNGSIITRCDGGLG